MECDRTHGETRIRYGVILLFLLLANFKRDDAIAVILEPAKAFRRFLLPYKAVRVLTRDQCYALVGHLCQISKGVELDQIGQIARAAEDSYLINVTRFRAIASFASSFHVVASGQ